MTETETDRVVPDAASLACMDEATIDTTGDGLLLRALLPPRHGLVAAEAAAAAPDLAVRAEAAVAAGGLALLLSAASAWRLDVAQAVVTAALRHWPGLETRRDGLRLAVHEAVVNAMLHGCLRVPPHLRSDAAGWLAHSAAVDAALADPERGDRPVLVTVTPEPDGWTACVVDRGPGFIPPCPDNADPAPADPPATRPRGRGIALMRAMCETVRWEEGGRSVHLTIAQRPSRDA
ncbi:ATP-binding protein [Roseospira goensis]|uniref:Anti-sigma regulatory factor (Ser/Thr protein kinase) n=1 Tax=Roseospira goensis TaxID=391922 RepID=A0A7W6S2Q5_9PROT|nr:ATP-binding protein [Roseospira goensis]MBB4287320.1 anti-sigma regulatory factor (Ser/Thr protein kinase) [Roseospira goensis]